MNNLEKTPDKKLEISDISLEFGGIKALTNVGFSIDDGSICGLIGPNGAGKSSLFNCITRFYEPKSGEIKFDGLSLLGLNPRKIIHIGIARTFQDLSLFDGLTVRQNILMGSHHRHTYGFTQAIFKMPKYVKEEALFLAEANEIIDNLDLSDVSDSEVRDLPFGTLKRVELGRALISQPKLLLLDEPAGGLTQSEVFELGDLILRLRKNFNLTILLVEHHMGLVMRISDKVVVLNFGQKIAEGSPDRIKVNDDVIKAYLGES